MKKLMATLLFATMVFSGCGNNAATDDKSKVEQKAEEVKQDAKDAATAVEQKAEEVKQDAKDAAAQAVDDATAAKDAAVQAADTAGNKLAETAMGLVDAAKSFFKDSREVPLAGALPGVALEKMVEAFGEPVFRDGNKWTFGNGMVVDMDEVKNIVEKIIITTPDITTPEGVAVGMQDTVLNTAYGPADAVDVESNGEVDYKYFSSDKSKSITFTTQGGFITEIESESRN